MLSQKTPPSMSQINVSVLYFAQLREVRGSTEEGVRIVEGTTIGELLNILEKDEPCLKGFEDSMIFFLNEERAEGDEVLKDGDIVALCPPVSGG